MVKNYDASSVSQVGNLIITIDDDTKSLFNNSVIDITYLLRAIMRMETERGSLSDISE